MKKIFFTWIIIIALPVFPENYSALQKGDEILKKVDRNLFPVSFESYRKLINIEPGNKKKEYVLWTAKKGHDKVVSTFLSPKSEVGRSTLRLGDNMWLYIPKVGKPIRVTSLQSVIGGIFNNSDIMRLDYSKEYHTDDFKVKEDQYVLRLKANNNSVAYDKLIMRVEKSTIVPSGIECYTASGMLIKTLHFKNTMVFADGFRRPSVVETDSPLHKGYKSIMIFAKIKKRTFPDEVFTIHALPEVKDLRQ
jgi:outer membrane lipoprotein-sorting protein